MSRALQIIALILPALAVVLVTYWMASVLTSYVKAGDVITPNKLAGFSWATGDGKVFNWHPVLMTFGFVFCSTTAALSYVALPFTHKTNKIIHLTSHAVGAVTALVGAIAVFRFHNEHNITNLYSLHSWLGIFTWVLFVAQWAFGFVTYFYPGARPSVRAGTINYHIGGGIGILALIYITAATGVLEKLAFNASCNVAGTLNGEKVIGYMASDCVLGNTIGLVLAASLIVAVTAIIHAKLAQHQAGPAKRGEDVPLVHSGGKHAKGYNA